MNFIRKIVEKKVDVWVKKQFTRYGRGIYDNKALLQISKGKGSFTVHSSFEFAGEFAFALAESVQGKTHVTGGIITTQDIRKEVSLDVAGIKQFAGVKTFLIDTEMNRAQIKELFTTLPSALIFLSFKTDAGELKTKVKNPKSSKPGQKKSDTDGPKADFCSLKTKDTELIEDLAFDVQKGFLKLAISHTFDIKDLAIPEQYKSDFSAARLYAIRKGKLIREIDVDGNRLVKEYTLEV